MVHIAFVNLSQGQVSLTGNGVAYTQNFNTLPAGASGAFAWTDNITLPGWYAGTGSAVLPGQINNITPGGAVNNTHWRNNTGIHSIGSPGNTDRSLGAHVNSGRGVFGVRLQNNTGSAITSFLIFYRGEQWKHGNTNSSANQEMTFGYVGPAATVNAVSITAAAITAVAALNFSAPHRGSGLNTTINGKDPGNFTNRSATVNVNVPAEQEILFQWTKWSGSDNATALLAIDDVIIVPLTGAPVAVSSQTELTFDQTEIGESRQLSIGMRAHNLSGNATLSFARGVGSAFSVSSTSLANTAINTISISNLHPTNINVIFMPTAAGLFWDTLIVSGGGLATPLRIPVSGTAFSDSPVTKYTVNIATPSNGTIEVTHGGGAIVTDGMQLPEETELTLTATANPGFEFVEWMDGSEDNPHSITLEGNVTISATFVEVVPPPIPTFTVTIIQPNVGTIMVLNDQDEVYSGAVLDSGTMLTLLAQYDASNEFVEWWDGNTEAIRGVVLTKDIVISATFRESTSVIGVNVCNTAIRVYPNPVYNELRIIIPSYARDLFANNPIELFDMKGRRVFSTGIAAVEAQFIASLRDNTVTINMSKFHPGTYILRIGNHTTQIIKK